MQKRKFGFALICILIVNVLFAQNNRRSWSEGDLSWDDFQTLEQSLGSSEISYFLAYKSEKQKLGDSSIIRLKAYCYMIPEKSWVNKFHRTDLLLKYNQVIFDLVELYRRKLQPKLDRASSILKVDQLLQQEIRNMNNEIARFQLKSERGRKEDVVDDWYKVTRRALANLERYKVPTFKKRNFGYGMHACIGSGLFTGSLGQHFNQTINLLFGFDLAYRRSILYLNGSLAWGKIKKDYLVEESLWESGKQAVTAIIDVSYGYAIIDGPNFKFVPFAGLGITEFSTANKDDEENDLRLVDYNLIFGVNADFKFGKTVKAIPNPYFAVKESVETSIRARIYITRANYFENLNGYAINLGVGICGFGNLIRLKY